MRACVRACVCVCVCVPAALFRAETEGPYGTLGANCFVKLLGICPLFPPTRPGKATTHSYVGSTPSKLITTCTWLIRALELFCVIKMKWWDVEQRTRVTRIIQNICVYSALHAQALSAFIVQELCESRGGRPGLFVLTSLLVYVDVKLY